MKKEPDDEVVIVGFSIQAPGCGDNKEFAELAWMSKDPIVSITEKHSHLWEIQQRKPEIRAGFVDQATAFDNEFFEIPESEALSMDPHQRLAIEQTVLAIQHAGIKLNEIAHYEPLILASSWAHDFERLLPDIDQYQLTGNMGSLVAGRIAHLLNVKGGALGVESACSSGPAAVHLARNLMLTGQTKMVIVIGTSFLGPSSFLSIDANGLLSPNGVLKAFDMDADGYVRSEGFSALILSTKRLAKEKNWKIYGTISGSTMNSDGLTKSIASPSRSAQRKCQEELLEEVELIFEKGVEHLMKCAERLKTRLENKDLSRSPFIFATDGLRHLISQEGSDTLLQGNPAIISGKLAAVLGVKGLVSVVDNTCTSVHVALDVCMKEMEKQNSNYGVIAAARFGSPKQNLEFYAPMTKSYDSDRGGYCPQSVFGIILLKRSAKKPVDKLLISEIDLRFSGSTMSPSYKIIEIVKPLRKSVRYMEMHGTGTLMGDDFETKLAVARLQDQATIVGSIKSSVGHTEAACGLLQLVKLVILSRMSRIPHQIHLQLPLPAMRKAINLRLPFVHEEIPEVFESRESQIDFDFAVTCYGLSGTVSQMNLNSFKTLKAQKIVQNQYFLFPIINETDEDEIFNEKLSQALEKGDIELKIAQKILCTRKMKNEMKNCESCERKFTVTNSRQILGKDLSENPLNPSVNAIVFDLSDEVILLDFWKNSDQFKKFFIHASKRLPQSKTSWIVAASFSISKLTQRILKSQIFSEGAAWIGQFLAETEDFEKASKFVQVFGKTRTQLRQWLNENKSYKSFEEEILKNFANKTNQLIICSERNDSEDSEAISGRFFRDYLLFLGSQFVDGKDLNWKLLNKTKDLAAEAEKWLDILNDDDSSTKDFFLGIEDHLILGENIVPAVVWLRLLIEEFSDYTNIQSITINMKCTASKARDFYIDRGQIIVNAAPVVSYVVEKHERVSESIVDLAKTSFKNLTRNTANQIYSSFLGYGYQYGWGYKVLEEVSFSENSYGIFALNNFEVNRDIAPLEAALQAVVFSVLSQNDFTLVYPFHFEDISLFGEISSATKGYFNYTFKGGLLSSTICLLDVHGKLVISFQCLFKSGTQSLKFAKPIKNLKRQHSIQSRSTKLIELIKKEILLLAPMIQINNDIGFFEMGLNSLLITKLVTSLKKIGLSVDLVDLFNYTTIAELAEFLDSTISDEILHVDEDDELIDDSDDSTITDTNFQSIEDLQGKQKDESFEISIVSSSCRLPGSIKDPQEFWESLVSGRNFNSRIPASRIPTRDTLIKGKKYGKSLEGGYFISNIRSFDNEFFGISKSEASVMDPQQRILLECVYECLDQGQSLANKKIGVFLGFMGTEYPDLMLDRTDALSMLSSAASVLSGRINYVFGLTGPSVTIDTACSSSLIAVEQAIESLKEDKCEYAVVAGVNVIVTERGLGQRANGGMLSPNGICNTFDSEANGYARADGCVALLLSKTLLLSNGGIRILDVKSNHCGKGASLTSPNGTAQKELLKKILDGKILDGEGWKNSRILEGAQTAQKELIEIWDSHGTGTKLGDPIEVNVLSELLDKAMVSSAKTSIGHGEAAAGATGLLKASLQLEHQYLPPTLHFSNLNGLIKMGKLAIPVIGQEIEALFAGVSSFGIKELTLKISQLPFKIDAIVHSAGVTRDALIPMQNEKKFLEVFEPKVVSIKNLEILEKKHNWNLEYFIVMSSVAATLGNKGQLNYSVSNSVADWMMAERRQRNLSGSSINWGNWLETGMAVSVNEMLGNLGFNGLKTVDSFEAFELVLRENLPKLVVAAIDWAKVYKNRVDLRDERVFDEQGVLDLGDPKGNERRCNELNKNRLDLRGIFIGCGPSEFSQKALLEISERPPGLTTGTHPSALAGRIAHWLKVQGPAESIDTACSSSMVALEHACRAINSGSCEAAIVGGTNLILHDHNTQTLRNAKMLSATHCRPFDASTDGYTRSEAIVVILLGKLEHVTQSLAILESIKIGHSGASSALTVPKTSAQMGLMKELGNDGSTISTVDLVECHMTGTTLGDPIELEAVQSVHSKDIQLTGAKALFGHTEPAAGLLSLVTVAEKFKEIIVLSSIAAVQGSFGQLAYSFANGMMSRIGERSGQNVRIFHLGPIEDVGMLSGEALAPIRRQIKENGWEFLRSEEVIWSFITEITGIERSTDKNNIGFMTLGIDSLMIEELREKCQSKFDLKIDPIDIFDNPTVNGLCEIIKPILVDRLKKINEQSVEEGTENLNFEEKEPESFNADQMAIIGYSGSFSGSRDIDEFWENLRNGKEMIIREESNLENFVIAGGMAPGYNEFDFEFWNVPKEEADSMDPQLRTFLQHAYKALESSGLIRERQSLNIGVFAGAEPSDYFDASEEAEGSLVKMFRQNMKDFLATWTAYNLNLNGPAIGIYSACSTFYSAIHQAAMGLKTGSIDVALVGAASLALPEDFGYEYQPGMVLSKDGQCRPFSLDADGTKALENLSEKEIDRIRIVECHGTGTKIGDAMELKAMRKLYGQREVLIGSVKANVGHGFAGAGFASEVFYPTSDNKLIDETKYSQVALFTLEMAIAAQLKEWGIEADLIAGHSLGEYSALTFANCLNEREMIDFLKKRGELCQTTSEARMLAVKGKFELPDGAEISAYLDEDFYCIVGPPNVMNSFEEALNNQKIDFKKIRTQHGFHSYMLDLQWPSWKNSGMSSELGSSAKQLLSQGSISTSDGVKAFLRAWDLDGCVAKIDDETNFFTAGGHSLLALQLVWAIRDNLGITVTENTVMEYPMFKDFTEKVLSTKEIVKSMEIIEKTNRLPLSYSQENMYLLYELKFGAKYNIVFTISFDLKIIEAKRLNFSIQRLIAEQESLRTIFKRDTNGIYQEILSLTEKFTVMVAALALTLRRWQDEDGAEKVIIGSPVSGRKEKEMQNVIGYFLNNIVISIDVSSQETLENVIPKAKEAVAKAMKAQQIPFHVLVQKLNVPRSGRHPLFNVYFNFRHQLDFPRVSIENTECPVEHNSMNSVFDLSLTIDDTQNGYRLMIEHNVSAHPDAMIEEFRKDYFKAIMGTQRSADFVKFKGERKEFPSLVPTISMLGMAYAPVDPTTTEQRLTEMKSVGLGENFFEKGGHSLLVLQFADELTQKLNRQIDHQNIFKYPKFRDLAQSIKIIENQKVFNNLQIITTLREAQNPKYNVYAIHAIGGSIFPYFAFLRLFPEEISVYAIDYKITYPAETFDELADLYTEKILQHTGTKRPFILGHSLGGTLSREVIMRLNKRGFNIQNVVMLDTWKVAKRALKTKDVTNFIEETFKGVPNIDSVVQRAQRLSDLIREHDYQLSDLPKIHLFKAEILGMSALKNSVRADLTEEMVRSMRSNGLQQLSNQPVEVHLVPGNHESMMSEENLLTVRDQILKIANIE
ncbi:unnamed protein product, partial [Mesorhabditis belari]|uniref:Fatty acid synthase n=1 Tax=Mesorhabditis belari TaxID=2138241 RepID=A0AAF3EHQ7_9BILA